MGDRDSVAARLVARVGDHRPGLLAGEQCWTWDQVVGESAARAEVARGRRVEGPFHIAVLLENVPEYIFWLGAAALAGATIVGINRTHRGADLAAEVAHTQPQLLITDHEGAALIDGLDLGLGPDRVLLVDSDEYTETVRRAAMSAEPTIDPDVTAATQFLLLFTSGSTGRAKAARCSQGRLVALGEQHSAKFQIGPDDVCYCCMPLFHGNALMALWAPALVVGAAVALTPSFSASRFLDDVRRYRATYFTYVGKAIGYLLAQPERPDDATTTLTHGFGTEASPEDQAAFERRFGARLSEGYGSSESHGMIRLAPQAPPGALGVPARPGVRVVDPATRTQQVPARLDRHGRVRNAEEAVGEIVDVDGAARFEGYWNDPEADAERVRHGWYWTGDLGYVDEAGFIYFAGRSGDWIRVDGENISALLTERVLRRHDRILTAAAYAVPDPRSGDQVMAAIEVPVGVEFAELDLGDFLAAQADLGTKGAPRFVRVSTALPATGSGKLRRAELKLTGWHDTDDPVYWWPPEADRRRPAYRLFTEQDRQRLVDGFAAAGRTRFLPRPA